MTATAQVLSFNMDGLIDVLQKTDFTQCFSICDSQVKLSWDLKDEKSVCVAEVLRGGFDDLQSIPYTLSEGPKSKRDYDISIVLLSLVEDIQMAYNTGDDKLYELLMKFRYAVTDHKLTVSGQLARMAVMQVSQEKATSTLPIILLGSLSTIRSTTRFQKLAFLADEEIIKEARMYADWKSHYSGPHSDNLTKDIEYYSQNKDITIKVDQNSWGSDVLIYSLTDKGLNKFDAMHSKFEKYVPEIKGSLHHYKHENSNTYLLQYVYEHYPNYTDNNAISDKRGR